MIQSAAANPLKPTVDDRPLWDLLKGALAYQALTVAHHLKLFPLLEAQPRTTAEVCEALNLARRPATALLSTCAAVGLLEARDGHYALTPLAAEYLLPSSPFYFGSFLDMLIANDQVFSFASLKQAVLTNTPQVYGGEDLYAWMLAHAR